MIEAWKQRSEPLGILVCDLPNAPIFETTGDRAHRFVVRNHDIPLIMAFNAHTQVRPVIAVLALGRKVGCCIGDEDDIGHVARRLYASSPGHLSSMPVAVWSGDAWSSHELVELI